MLNADFRDILCSLLAEQVEFLVVGSYAMAVYGRARATEDLDIWVRPSVPNSHRVMQALLRFGAPTSMLSAEDFQAADRVFQMGNPPWRIDFLTSIDGVNFEDAWSRRVLWRVEEITIPVLSCEHLIVNKRACGRPIDLADVQELETPIDQLRHE